MTTPEATPEVATFKIVVCGTCDVVFRTHPGRPSCPACGGDPDLELGEGTISTPAAEEASPTEAETPAPAEATAEEPADPAADGQGQDFDEVERQAQAGAMAARAAGWSPTEQ
jgi:uncharacterized Zn finger protein (UPF0148 family)